MEIVKKNFPFLNEFFTTSTGTIYARGEISGLKVLVSQRGDQWILTIDNKYFVVVDSKETSPPLAILQALRTIQNGGKVEPNSGALLLRSIIG